MANEEELWWFEERRTIEVVEGNDAPSFTGLYDARSRLLHRNPSRVPMGFDLTRRQTMPIKRVLREVSPEEVGGRTVRNKRTSPLKKIIQGAGGLPRGKGKAKPAKMPTGQRMLNSREKKLIEAIRKSGVLKNLK